MIFSIFNKKSAEELADEAQKAFIKLEYNKAIKLYKNAIKKTSNSDETFAEYYFNLAIMYKNINFTKNALNSINKAIEIKDDNYKFYFERAEIKNLLNDKSKDQDLEKAYNLLKEYLSDEDYIEVLKVIEYPIKTREQIDGFANVYLKINNSFKAIEIINNYILQDKKDVSLYDLKTDILTKMGRLQDAIDTISKAIIMAPNCGHYYIMRSVLNNDTNNIEKAKSDIEIALNCDLSEEDRKNAEKIKKDIT